MDAMQAISKADPGLAVYCRFARNDPGAELETGFLIQESAEFLKRLPRERVQIACKASLINYGGVGFIVVYLLFQNDFDMLYEICFNYHADGARESFSDLAEQGKVTYNFFTQARRVRSIQTENKFQDFFRGAMAELVLYPRWEMHHFDQAKASFYRDFARPETFFRTAARLDRFS